MQLIKLPKKKNQKKGKKKPGQEMMKHIISVVIFFLVLSTLYSVVFAGKNKKEEIPLSAVAQQVVGGSVSKIVVEGDTLTATYSDGSEKIAKKEPNTALSDTLANYGVTSEQLATVEIKIQKERSIGSFLLAALPIAIPLIFLIVFFVFMSGQMKGGAMKAFSFGQSKARMIDPNDSKQRITFADVAGNKEAKIELLEVVDFLRNPKKFLDIGAKIPKGVLLMGSPGTGKTLLARAVAGEAKVPFFYLSGSEFVEMFVGVGASRVRDLFAVAKKVAPSIIFIDEIDAVGRSRGVGTGGGNDEREQTLNQILVEMDGFEPSEKVVVMAATNRSDVLDSALLRPGRFDRRVILDVPDRADREQILAIHARKKPFADDVNLKLIAERTPGFSGADLESLMNEAAILAAREDKKVISQDHLLRSVEKVMIGAERKSHLHTEQEKKLVAYHEAGHALVASVLPNADPVHKVSIVARGHTGGYTLKLPLEERKLPTKKQFIDDIAMSLGGYAAEKIVFDDITTGPSNDLQVASGMARDMVTRYGMSDVIGPVAFEGSGRTLFGENGVTGSEYSDKMAETIDAEVRALLDAGLQTATKVLTEKREVLDAIVAVLLDKETLEQEDYNAIIMKYGIQPKRLPITETKTA